MTKFDKELIDNLRKICYRVYVDKETPEQYIGSLRGYTGDRVRIYIDGCDYEEAVICHTDEELRAVIKEFENAAKDCGLTFAEMYLCG